MVASPLLFRERMTKKQVLCFVGATAGLVLVINPGALTGSDPARGVLFGLAAAADTAVATSGRAASGIPFPGFSFAKPITSGATAATIVNAIFISFLSVVRRLFYHLPAGDGSADLAFSRMVTWKLPM